MNLQQFESFVLNQKTTEEEKYDKTYFMNAWRTEGNSYSLEARRAIEGQNPHNIKRVFNPQRVLDVGCGPGALMLFMQELGLDVWGFDFSKDAIELADPAVKNRITYGSVTEPPPFSEKFDLVVCRELLEHLTVLQVRKAVYHLCQMTTKYVYVTTRFHPKPDGLLDVTDDKQTDPTHITAMNKDLLRLMFVLEGLQCRPDLEAELDWKKYGRVLVYEKK
jgi:2-polyprenyl-3-methyl-5-hydroxy-6-metoxy-1,4-benzoquinol methylase